MALVQQTVRWVLTLLILFILAAIVLVSGALLALRFHDDFRDWVIVSALKPYGVVAVTSRVDSVVADQLVLNQLSVHYENQTQTIIADLNQLSLQRVDSALPFTALAGWRLDAARADIEVQALAADAGPPAARQSAQNVGATTPTLADFLPQNLLQQVPLAQVTLAESNITYQPPSGDAWHLKGNVAVSPAGIESDFHLQHAERHFQGELTLAPSQVKLLLGQADKPWISIDSRLEQVNGQLVAGGRAQISDLAHAEDWLALLPLTIPETYNWQGNLDLTFTFNVPESTVQKWLTGDTKARDGVMLAARFVHDIKLQLPTLDLQRVAMKGSANVQIAADSLVLQHWNLEQSRMTLDIRDPTLQQRLAPLLGPKPAAGTGLSLMASGELTNVRIQAGAVLPQNIQGKMKLALAAPDSTQLKGFASFTGRSLDADRFKGNADILLDDLTQFSVNYDYHANKQALDFTLSSEKNTLATATFNDWAEKLALPFQLELGDFAMAMTGRVSLKNLQTASVSGKVQVSDWHGNLEKNHFESLTSEFDFSGDLDQFSLQGTVKNGLFDVGIPITDIRYDLSLESNHKDDHLRIKVSNLESRLVGGLVRIPEFEWDSQRQETGFHVVIYNWQFAQIMDLLNRDDLQVSGILDGMLPITVSTQGWKIQDGRLAARKPGGVIRYLPEQSVKASLSQNQQMKMATDILENFQYSVLDAVVNQMLDGTQYINLTLKGKNPDAYGGTPVNLNLNIEHNIKPLMDSLTLPGRIQENWNHLETINPQ